jgi:hypothetical protein
VAIRIALRTVQDTQIAHDAGNRSLKVDLSQRCRSAARVPPDRRARDAAGSLIGTDFVDHSALVNLSSRPRFYGSVDTVSAIAVISR